MVDFGWIHPDNRTSEVKLACENLILGMPDFNLIGPTYTYSPRACLWDCVLAKDGKHLPAFFQNIGSCTGMGKAKAEWYLMYADAVQRKEKETPIMPYEPYGYAQGRVCAGITGSSDGGTGAGCAQAAKQFGVLSSETKGLTKWKVVDNGNTINWPGDVDKSWGNRGAPAQYITEGKKHVVKTTALLKNSDQAIDALQNWFPITIASDWGGQDRCPVKNGFVLNQHTGIWQHQMQIAGYINDPTLGEIFNVNNSWGAYFHNSLVDNNNPPCSFWITRKDLDYIISQGDSFIYSQFDGFPINKIYIDPNLFKVI